jgi:hypothetical protein
VHATVKESLEAAFSMQSAPRAYKGILEQIFEAKAFRAFIRIYSLFKSERLSASIELTLHNALIRSVMTYACPAWELAPNAYPLKLQCLQNKVLCTTGNNPRCTPVT